MSVARATLKTKPFVVYATINHVTRTKRGDPVTELCCPCGQAHRLWGEFWWVEGKHRWVFFDDLRTSETYGEQVEHCPACARRLERKDLLISR